MKRLIRCSKRLFEKEVASRSKTNPKGFWKYIRKKLKTKNGISPLFEDNKDPSSLKFEDKEKANILQKQFCRVFIRETDDIPILEKRNNKSLNDLKIFDDMVRQEILDLNISKSFGPDEISPVLLINLVDYVACPLAMLMNKTLKHGTLPQDWKKAFVSPIHKKGARNIAENYKPISLTSVVCKLMEKFVKDAVFNHLIEYNLLSKKQFGFVNGRSIRLLNS